MIMIKGSIPPPSYPDLQLINSILSYCISCESIPPNGTVQPQHTFTGGRVNKQWVGIK